MNDSDVSRSHPNSNKSEGGHRVESTLTYPEAANSIGPWPQVFLAKGPHSFRIQFSVVLCEFSCMKL